MDKNVSSLVTRILSFSEAKNNHVYDSLQDNNKTEGTLDSLLRGRREVMVSLHSFLI
jgi:hypothetical protein